MLSWWAIETHTSPNQKEVVMKILGSHLYEDKLTEHLMGTQVIFFFILGFLFLSFYCLLLHLTFFLKNKMFQPFFLCTLDLQVWGLYIFLDIENLTALSFEVCFQQRSYFKTLSIWMCWKSLNKIMCKLIWCQYPSS